MNSLLNPSIKAQSIEQQAQTLLQAAPYLADKIELYGDIGEATPAQALVEVLKFMALVKQGQPITPSVRVDNVWHQFILSTRLYSEYCTNCYDKFLHHTPSNDRVSNQSQFELCLTLYQRQFGQPNKWFWGLVWQEPKAGDCGSCESL